MPNRSSPCVCTHSRPCHALKARGAGSRQLGHGPPPTPGPSPGPLHGAPSACGGAGSPSPLSPSGLSLQAALAPPSSLEQPLSPSAHPVFSPYLRLVPSAPPAPPAGLPKARAEGLLLIVARLLGWDVARPWGPQETPAQAWCGVSHPRASTAPSGLGDQPQPGARWCPGCSQAVHQAPAPL